jgi:hypothetical protein
MNLAPTPVTSRHFTQAKSPSFGRRLVGAAIVLWPMSVFADVGTPLVWGSTFHLLLGNAIIGVLEGLLLAQVFGLRKRQCVGHLILANYVSAWTGIALTSFLFSKLATDICSGLKITWLLVAASYFLTLMVEWPFVARCFRGTQRWIANSVKGSLLVQSISYALLFGGYWLLSGTSLYSNLDVVSPKQILVPEGISMFFFSSADGHVYRSQLGSAIDTKVTDLSSTNRWEDYLQLTDSQTESNYWDLAAVLNRQRSTPVVLVPKIASTRHIPPEQGWRTHQYYGWGLASFQVSCLAGTT